MCTVQVFSKESELEIATGKVLKSLTDALEVPFSEYLYIDGPLELEEIEGFVKGVLSKLKNLRVQVEKVISKT